MWRKDLRRTEAARRRGLTGKTTLTVGQENAGLMAACSGGTGPLSTQPQGTRRRRSPHRAPYSSVPFEAQSLMGMWKLPGRMEAEPNLPPPPPSPPPPSARKRKAVSSSSRPSVREQDAARIEDASAGNDGMAARECFYRDQPSPKPNCVK